MGRTWLRAAATAVAGVLLVLSWPVPGPLPVPPPAVADSVTDQRDALERQIAELRNQLQDTSADLVNAAVSLKRAQAGLVAVSAALATAQAAVVAAQQRDAELASQLAFAQAQEDKSAQAMAASRAATESTRAAVGQIARETYVNSGLGTLSVALQADSPEQFADRLSIAVAALSSSNGAIQRLATQQADLRAETARLDAIRAQVAALKQQSAAAVVARQQAAAQLTADQAQQQQLVTQQTQAVATIRAKVAAERARLAQAQREQAQLEAMLAARARGQAQRNHGSLSGPPPAGSGMFGYPASGPITSGFGMRYHPILHIWRMHTGIDFGIGCGTPVYAAAAGTVISAGWAGGYGNRVVVDHGWHRGADFATTYNHLTSIVVRSGAVSQGQLIAYSGTTGLSTGCHLHFEVLVNGSFVNPQNYL